jgi:hypothetical protein
LFLPARSSQLVDSLQLDRLFSHRLASPWSNPHPTPLPDRRTPRWRARPRASARASRRASGLATTPSAC